MRVNDIKYNPVFFSYAIFFPGKDEKPSSLRLYITKSKVEDPAVLAHLKQNNIEVFDYSDIIEHLR
jgi:hypothetical protein